jgi:hypothetical protein
MVRRGKQAIESELEGAFRQARAQLEGIGQQLATTVATRPRRYVTAEQLAPRIHKSPRYLLRHWREFPFARKLPFSRDILFDEQAFEEYLASLPGPTR